MPRNLVNKQNPEIPRKKASFSIEYKPMQFVCTLFITQNRQKQAIDVYVQLLKTHFPKRSPQKSLLEKFYPMYLFSGFYGITKI